MKEVQEFAKQDIIIVIAGNKCDKEKECVVSLEEAKKFSDSCKAKHFQTSAKTGKGVHELFIHLTQRKFFQICFSIYDYKEMLLKRTKTKETAPKPKPSGKQIKVDLRDSIKPRPPKKDCC